MGIGSLHAAPRVGKGSTTILSRQPDSPTYGRPAFVVPTNGPTVSSSRAGKSDAGHEPRHEILLRPRDDGEGGREGIGGRVAVRGDGADPGEHVADQQIDCRLDPVATRRWPDQDDGAVADVVEADGFRAP